MIQKLVAVLLLGVSLAGCSKSYPRSLVTCGFVADYAAVAMSQATSKMSRITLTQVTRGFVIQNDPNFPASEPKNVFLREAIDIVVTNRSMYEGVPLVSVKMYALAMCMGRQEKLN